MDIHIISYIKSVDKLRDILFFYRRWLFLLFLLISLNEIKAQSSGIITEDVRFESEGISLAGTIYKPRHSHAAVVLVHGSDQTPRMREFASVLANKGISVLTYDKRGVGESGGIYVGPEVGTNNVDTANLILLAKDASAAVNILHQRDKSAPIGLIGFSQAGWIIPIAAKSNPTVEFMVVFCGSLVSTYEQLLFQFYTEGNPDFWDSHNETETREYIRNNADLIFEKLLFRFLEKEDPGFWDNHTIAEAREHIRNNAERYQFASTDPYDALISLSIPGIWLWGSKDVQVPVGFSIERLNALKVHGKPYEYCLFSTLGHNVAFSNSTEPIDIAIQWIKNRKN